MTLIKLLIKWKNTISIKWISVNRPPVQIISYFNGFTHFLFPWKWRISWNCSATTLWMNEWKRLRFIFEEFYLPAKNRSYRFQNMFFSKELNTKSLTPFLGTKFLNSIPFIQTRVRINLPVLILLHDVTISFLFLISILYWLQQKKTCAAHPLSIVTPFINKFGNISEELF